MAIISFNFTTVHAEVKQAGSGKIKIGNNMGITSAEKADINFADTSKAGIKFGFEYKSVYEPDIGNVLLKGTVVYLHDADKVKAALALWKKDKKVAPEVGKEVMTAVLQRANVEALIISRDVGLPSPIPLPKVQIKEKQEK